MKKFNNKYIPWNPPAADVPLILSGATRWLLPVEDQPLWWQGVFNFGDGSFATVGEDYESHPYRGPFEVGDVLWLRESHVMLMTGGGQVRYAMFRDGSHKFETGHYDPGLPMEKYSPDAFEPYRGQWRPPSRMPKWASRCHRRVTSVVAIEEYKLKDNYIYNFGFRDHGDRPARMMLMDHLDSSWKIAANAHRRSSPLWLWVIGIEDIADERQ